MQLPRNFRYPFEAKTVGDFFNRFNTTVSEYIRKHVYVRLGSESGGALSASLNILLITMLMGLWYGLRLNLLVWGAVLGLFVMMEALLFPKIFKDVPQFYSRIYTFAITFVSFAIFTGDSLPQSAGYLAAMFGLGGVSVYNQSILYLLDSNYLVLLAAVFASTSLTSRVAGDFRARVPRCGSVMGALTHAGMLALVVGFLLGGVR